MPIFTPNHAPEQSLAVAGVLGACAVAVIGSVVAGVLDGGEAGVAVGAGAVLVAALSIVAMPLYKRGAKVGNDMVVAMSLAGLGLRGMVALVVLVLVAQLGLLPMNSFAIGLALGLVGALVAEIIAAARDPRFFWLSIPSTPHSDTERQLT